MPPMKYVDGSSMREDYESLYIRTFPLGGALTTDGDMRRADANKGYVHMVDQPGGIDDARLTRDVIKAPLGHIREFSETDTPKQLRRIVTYSTEPDFATYHRRPGASAARHRSSEKVKCMRGTTTENGAAARLREWA